MAHYKSHSTVVRKRKYAHEISHLGEQRASNVDCLTCGTSAKGISMWGLYSTLQAASAGKVGVWQEHNPNKENVVTVAPILNKPAIAKWIEDRQKHASEPHSPRVRTQKWASRKRVKKNRGSLSTTVHRWKIQDPWCWLGKRRCNLLHPALFLFLRATYAFIFLVAPPLQDCITYNNAGSFLSFGKRLK